MIDPETVTGGLPYLADHSRRRFYLMRGDIYATGLSTRDGFVNKEAAMPPREEQRGRFAVPSIIPGQSEWLGLPPYRETPHYVLGSGRRKMVDFYRFTEVGDNVFGAVSDRARRLLEALDPQAFEFGPLKVTHGRDKEPELGPYWLMAVIRQLDADDEAHSTGDFQDLHWLSVIEFRNPYDVRFDAKKVGDAHAFWMQRYRAEFVVDEVIVDAVREHGYRGGGFTPLQPPIEWEKRLKNQLEIGNSYYWLRRGLLPTVHEIMAERQAKKQALGKML